MNASTWKLRPRGIATVCALELRQRVRSIKWYVALGIWFLFHAGIALLAFGGVAFLAGSLDGEVVYRTAAVVFTISTILTVFALVMVLPAVSAGSINGDRNAGTLATLQASLLSPFEIAVGKVLAGWVLGLAFIALAVPVFGLTGLLSGASVFYLARLIIAMAVVALFVVLLGMGFSAVTKRQLGSVVLTYIVVLGVTVIAPVVYLMTLPLVSFESRVTVYEQSTYPDTSDDSTSAYVFECEERVETRVVPRTDLALPLLLVNPVVMVADQSPPLEDVFIGGTDGQRIDGLQLIRTGIRHLAQPMHPSHFNSCGAYGTDGGPPRDFGQPTGIPVWPLGFAAWGAVAAGALVLTTLRLRAPMRTLLPGQRIA